MPTRKITRVARRPGTTGLQAYPKVLESADLIDFLISLQQINIALLPIYPHKGLSILGRGLSGLIKQSTADVSTILAFKEAISSRLMHDTEQDQDWYSLITELTILQHPPIRANPHLINVLGVSFSITSNQKMGQRAWPLIITSKASRGDLSTMLRDEQSELLNQKTRMILLAGFAEAIFVLHSCGVSHGDLKTDNILVQTSKFNELCLVLIDFGSSAIGGQTRIPTKSEPWNAPELEFSTREFDCNELVQTDLYSFGLVCLHILLPLKDLNNSNLCLIRTQEQTDDQWTEFVSQTRNQKMLHHGEGFVCQILGIIESSNASPDEKNLLKKVVETTIEPPPGKRKLPCYHLHSRSVLHAPSFAYGSTTTEHSSHLNFDVGIALGELDDTDYVLHANILQDLMHKADYSACEFCRLDFAFQVSICRRIGLGCGKDMIGSEQWRMASRRTHNDLVQAFQKIEDQYTPPNGISKDLADALGIGILICNERTEEYQISRRLFEAERALKDRIEARASLFGESHLSLGKSKSELSQVLQAQNHLAEAEVYQVSAIEIFSRSLGDRHSSVLKAKFDLANLMAKQGLLRKAESLALETQPIFEEVLGLAHPDTATMLQIMAIIHFELGKIREAERSMRKVVMLRTNALTSTHPLTVRAELSLATALRGQGRVTETNELMKEIDLKLSGILTGNELSRAQLSMVQAALYRNTGQLEQAFQKIAEGLAALDKLRLPANDGLRLDMLEILSSLHKDIGEIEKQEAILRQILKFIGSKNESDQRKSRFECLLARSILAQGRESEAYALAQELSATSCQYSVQDPDIYAGSIDIMAQALCYRGQINEAERMRRDLLDLCIKEWGENNTHTLNATYSLGVLLADRGEYRKAQDLYEQALANIDKDTQPGLHKIMVTRLLANALVAQGEFEKAKAQCEQGIAWAVSAMGDRHVQTLALYNALGRSYIMTGQFTQADELYSTKLQKESVGTSVECYVLEHLAVLRRRQLRIPEAMELKRKSEALMKSQLGELHPEFIRMQGNVLADYMANPEDFTDDIEKDVLKNIDRKKAIFGTNHPSTIITMCDLAYVWAQKGRLIEADEQFEKLWATGQVRLVKNPDEYAKLLGKRAEIRFSLNCLEDAEELEREALAVRLSIFDRNHNSVLVTMGNLASTLCAQGKYEEAERHLRHILAVREEALEANVPSITRYLIQKTALGAVLFYQKRFPESIEHYATSVTLAERMNLPSKFINKWRAELKEITNQSEVNEI